MSAQEPILAAGIHLLLRDKLPRYGYRGIKAFAVYDDGLKEEFSYRVYEGNGKALFFSWKAPQGKAITSVTINMSGCSSIDDIWIMTGNEIAQSTPKNMYECFERATDFAGLCLNSEPIHTAQNRRRVFEYVTVNVKRPLTDTK